MGDLVPAMVLPQVEIIRSLTRAPNDRVADPLAKNQDAAHAGAVVAWGDA